MSEYDRGVRASIVAHDIFYGAGQAIGLGLNQYRQAQSLRLEELRSENDRLRTDLDIALHNEALWETSTINMEADRDYCKSLVIQLEQSYNALVGRFNLLLKHSLDLERRLDE